MPYTVQAGDNPFDVARRLGMTIEQYQSLNPHLDRPAPGTAPGTGFGQLQVGDIVYSPNDLPIQPGLQAEQFADQLAMEKFLAELLADLEQQSIDLQEQRDVDTRRLTEAQLGANPADFVAFELYKRSLQEQGFESTSPARSDAEIQNLFRIGLDLNEGSSIGTGQFGVELPTTESISRSELGKFSPTDVGILTSFLRGGVDTGGGFQGINPEDFFTDLEEGLIPTISTGPTRTVF